MKITMQNGGLANQAFQHIFARHYEITHPGEIMYIDDSEFFLSKAHNGYELGKIFGIKTHRLSEYFDADVWEYMLSEYRKGVGIPETIRQFEPNLYMLTEVDDIRNQSFKGKVLRVPCNEYHPEMFEVEGNVYYNGYWINKNWFSAHREEFLREFTFPVIVDDRNKEYLEKIQTTNSVSMHIRRGDYVKLGLSLGTEMYRQFTDAFIQHASNEWNIFVFSDDPEWCKENAEVLGLNQFEAKYFIEGNVQGKNYIDMHLMSECKAMILSNSAFCYLATLLNTKRGIVINPTSREV